MMALKKFLAQHLSVKISSAFSKKIQGDYNYYIHHLLILA